MLTRLSREHPHFHPHLVEAGRPPVSYRTRRLRAGETFSSVYKRRSERLGNAALIPRTSPAS
jgi:hypothetical protein